ncbi:MAG: hypothetical protein OXC31_19955 [Spirochaetaceae bacterium]|nr:hypothetical protein [Spirochaetaceae bacterium]
MKPFHRRPALLAAHLLVALALIAAGCQMRQIESAGPREPAPGQTPGSQPESQPGAEPPDPPREEEPPGALPQQQLPDLAIASVGAGEKDGTLSFTVSLSAASGAPVSVAFGTEDGTATAGADYQPARGRLTFAAASVAARMIEVTVVDDDVAEPAETLTVRLSEPRGATLRVAAATGTIIDDEQRALLVEPRELNVPEGGTGSYRVLLGSRPTGPVTARIPEPAELSVDPTELRFTPADWSISQQVQVTAARDQDGEADPPVKLVHQASGGDYQGTTASVRVTVVEADAATLAVTGGRTPEGDGPMRFEVTLSAAVSREVTVDHETAAAGDTATSGVDYVSERGTLRFPAGSNAPQRIEVTLHDDTRDEPDERITLTLGNASGATLAGGGDTATAMGTIEDDDDPPVAGIGDDSVTEGVAAGELEFAVLLDRASDRTVTIGYATADVTATAGTDYTRVSGTLTFDPGATTRTVAVPVRDDALPEPDEELTVTLSAAVNATVDDARRRATGTIRDDEELPVLTIESARAGESDGSLPLAVTLQPESGDTVTVSYATADATATGGADYTATSGTLTFDPGVVTRTLSVPILQDDVDEGEQETFSVTLSDPVNATLAGATAIGTITDDDDAPDDDHGNTRATATSISQGSPIAGRLESAADVDYFKVTVNSTSSLFVATDPGKVGDAGYPRGSVVRFEASNYISPNNDSLDAVNVELNADETAEVYARVSGSLATRYDVAVWVLERTESDTSFDIELRYLGTEPTATQRNTIRGAADVWERAITGDLPRRIIINSTWECEDRDPSAFGDYLDDLRIDIRLRRIDGAGGAIASAGLCVRRTGGLPVIGDVTLDTSDLESLGTAGLGRVAVHEMAHVLGFGPFSGWRARLKNPALGYVPGPGQPALADTHFTGPSAITAFDEAGGTSHTGAKVPVENDTGRYGLGSLDVHWREAVFANEVMTASISIDSGESQPLSKVTIAALADLGYSVDYTVADAYTLPSQSQSASDAARRAVDKIHLGDDIRRGPIHVAEFPDQQIPLIAP